MKSAKFFIVFTFLFAFALQFSAQDKTPKIVWKNLQEKYESFYDIKPFVVNEGNESLFIYSPYFSLSLYKWNEVTNEWFSTIRMSCGTGVKISGEKLKPQNKLEIFLDNETWDTMTIGNDLNFWNFKSFPDYTGKGKYKLGLLYSFKKSDSPIKIFSPEFEVIEKDFKK
jgi:hypothetical protein